jgi:hypothetical protein
MRLFHEGRGYFYGLKNIGAPGQGADGPVDEERRRAVLGNGADKGQRLGIGEGSAETVARRARERRLESRAEGLMGKKRAKERIVL